MASIVQICNMALTRIGHSQLIDSLDEKSLPAELCTLLFEQLRDLALSEFDWPFAEKRVVLADVGSPVGAWHYRYSYPSDCLKARCIAVPGAEVVPSSSRIPFKTIYSDDGRAILTDQAEAELVYTVRVTDSSYYPPAFVSALSWLLASELVGPIKADGKLASGAYQAYRIAAEQAAALTFGESNDGVMPVSEFERVRG